MVCAMSSQRANSNTVLGSTYLHIGDSGLSVSVTDRHGPTLEFKFQTFGHPATTQVFTTVEAIREIGEMLLSVANSGHDFGEEYVCKAWLCSSQRYGEERRSDFRTFSTGSTDHRESDGDCPSVDSDDCKNPS